MKFRTADWPFWDAVIAEKPKSEWSKADLVVAANLARAMADAERIAEMTTGKNGDVKVTTLIKSIAVSRAAAVAAGKIGTPMPAFPLTLAGNSQFEGNSGTALFTYTLGRGNAGTYVYTWAVTPSGANPASADDFAGGVFPSGSGTITAAEASKTITFSANGDTTVEPDGITKSDFTAGLATVLTLRQETTRHRGGYDVPYPYIEGGSPSTPPSSTTTNDAIGGYSNNTGARFDLARHIRINLAAVPGGVTQRYISKPIEGLLAWKYGTAGDANTDLVAALNSGHRFRTVRHRCRIIWARGSPSRPGAIRSPTASPARSGRRSAIMMPSAAMRARPAPTAALATRRTKSSTASSMARTLSPTGSDGLPVADQRRKVQVIGDLYTNGTGAATGSANASGVFDAISQMVAACETAQGVAAGQGRIVVLGRYRTTSSGYSGDDATDAVEIADAQLKAALPNYFCKLSDALWQAGAPDGPYPDAAAFANRACPTGLRSDATHPSSTGYQVQGQFIAAFIKSKGWDRA
ncbi:Terminase small subunit [Sphingomonas paucimobilis]|nr:Terminase small subunit [Sphingomonas paucimobilis]